MKKSIIVLCLVLLSSSSYAFGPGFRNHCNMLMQSSIFLTEDLNNLNIDITQTKKDIERLDQELERTVTIGHERYIVGELEDLEEQLDSKVERRQLLLKNLKEIQDTINIECILQ